MAETTTKLPVAKDNQPAKAADRLRHPLGSLRREIDRLFEDFYPLNARSPLSRAISSFDFTPAADWFSPAFDMTEQNGHFEITAELPGLDEKNISLRVANRILTIKGEKIEEKKEEEKDYHLSERHYGSFQRSFELPASVDPDKVEATFAKGVLNIRLPKTPESMTQEKKIEIKAA